MLSRKVTTFIAASAAAAVVGAGAYTIDGSFTNNGSGTASAAPTVQAGQAPGTGQATQSGPNQTSVGQIPANWQPGSGTIITGAAAEKATAVAVAKYPGGTVNRVLKFSDGSYAVHMIKISWPHHVFVSANFEVTGAIG